MKKFLPILVLISSCSIQPDKTKNIKIDTTKIAKSLKPKVIADATNTFTGNIENFELEYIVQSCACASWVTLADFSKYQDNKLAEHGIFIEPASDNLELPLYFDASRHRIKVKGQFYTQPEYPKGTVQTDKQIEKAKVFRYTEIEVVDKPNFNPDSKIETLTLTYNAISCTCAQWSESKFDNNPYKRIYYWLEPSNKNLIEADTLFDGKNLPVQIKVTGQIVSEKGFPKRDLSKVGQDEAGKVFRYTKIKVVKIGHL